MMASETSEILQHHTKFLNIYLQIGTGCIFLESDWTVSRSQHNFDVERTNPFAYFTQIVYYAFLRRIAKEKKQTHVKHQLISKQEYVPFDTIDGDTSKYSVVGFDPNVMVPDEAVYKPKKKKEETESKRVGLENFMDEEDIK